MNSGMPYGYNPNMMQPMFPNQPNFNNMMDNDYNNLSNKIMQLEKRINNIEKKLNIFSSNVDDSYQTNMHMM